MTANPLFLISLFMSALISFFVMAFIVESSLVLFKVKHARMRYILRFLPFVSLFAELLFNQLSIGYWLNPLNCDSCVQKLLLTVFFPKLKLLLNTHEISLSKYFASKISHPIFSFATISFFVVTAYVVSRRLIEGFTLAKRFQSLVNSEDICVRSIENQLLKAAVQNNNVKIFSSEKITIPMATYPKAIFIPSAIVRDFPQVEFEAIVAHELEHLLWKDQFSKLISLLISAIFWWLPTRAWHTKMNFEQEIACDRSILKYGFKEECLASALVKVTASIREKPHENLCYLTRERHPALRRIQIMLGLNTTNSKRWEWGSYIIVMIGSIVGIVCVIFI